MMKRLLLPLLIVTSLFGGEFVVVTSTTSSLNKLNAKVVRDIFLMKRHFVEGIKIIPVNATASSNARKAFEKEILHMTRRRLARYWTKMHFQGARPPVVQSSNNAIKLFVQNVNGSIAYIPKEQLNNTLKVLYEF